MLRVVLATCVAFSFALPFATIANAGGPDCTELESLTGDCPSASGVISGGGAVIRGEQSGKGRGDKSTQPHDPDNNNGGEVSVGAGEEEDPVCNPSRTRCLGDSFLITDPDEHGPITLNDVKAFTPVVGVSHMQPKGWMVVGLDANFFVTGGASVKNGELLGFDASVRFTPIRWRWNFGDGEGATRASPGASWAAQNIEEFDATPTSHVFDQAGTYTINLEIDYSVDYQFNGSGWVPIEGILTVASNDLVATAGSAKTVLVDRNCTQNPRGPGC